jgi:hypothetical protein
MSDAVGVADDFRAAGRVQPARGASMSKAIRVKDFIEWLRS